MKSEFEYILIEDIDEDIEEFTGDLIQKLVLIAEKLEENYFNISYSAVAKSEELKTQEQTQ